MVNFCCKIKPALYMKQLLKTVHLLVTVFQTGISKKTKKQPKTLTTNSVNKTLLNSEPKFSQFKYTFND